MDNEHQGGRGRPGLLLIVCGPSGVGKSTLCHRLIDEFGVEFSVSYTTRTPRPGEVDGEAYHFVSPETFADLLAADAFAEHAEVHGHRYGTAHRTVAEALAAGRDLIFDIDIQGAEQLREAFAEASSVMVLPPSLGVLEDRLRGRKTETEATIVGRLGAARNEIAHAETFDYVVVNSDLDQAYDDFRSIYRALTLTQEKMKAWVWRLLA